MNTSALPYILQATPVLKIESTLGEGPLWDSVRQVLYWVDIEKKVVHVFDPHTNLHREWPVPKKVGTVALASKGYLLLALQGEIAELDPATGKIKFRLNLESELPENRCNDGKCDPEGRFWVGTMHVDCKPRTGSLYCIDHQWRAHKVLQGLTIANGMGWSPEGTYMYFIDSADHQVKRYKYDPQYVSLTEERIVLQFENQEELPDGMCVDNNGMLWIGFWGGGRVGRYDPATGKHLADVRVAAPHVTSCCFGGKDLQTLYITTARDGLSQEQLLKFPLSGSLFSCDTSVKGSQAHIFGQKG